MPALPFHFGSNPARHPSGGVARLINCYAADVGEGQRARLPIYASPGLTSFATHSGGGAVRCMITNNSQLYVVSNRVLSVFDTAGTEMIIGGIPSDGHVTAAVNRKNPGQQIAFVCDGLAYMCANNVLTQVTDSDLAPPIAVDFIGGYFVYAISDGRFFWSELDEGSAIDALDFASAEGNPDGLVGVKVRGDDLVLIGPRSTEFHGQTGSADSPFARSVVAAFGCLSPKSITACTIVSKESITDSVAWVATDRTGRYAGVIMLDGYSARKISSEALDEVIRDETLPGEITATSWVSGGHGFLAVSGTDWTWVFDTSVGLWHERVSYGASRWQIDHVVDLAGTLIAGANTGGALYSMQESVGTEGSDPLIMTLQTSLLPGENEINTLEIICATGVGEVGGETDPVIGMSWSEDGQNWSTERMRALGAEAQTRTRVRWNGLGTNRNRSGGRSFRFRSSADATRVIYGATVNEVA